MWHFRGKWPSDVTEWKSVSLNQTHFSIQMKLRWETQTHTNSYELIQKCYHAECLHCFSRRCVWPTRIGWWWGSVEAITGFFSGKFLSFSLIDVPPNNEWELLLTDRLSFSQLTQAAGKKPEPGYVSIWLRGELRVYYNQTKSVWLLEERRDKPRWFWWGLFRFYRIWMKCFTTRNEAVKLVLLKFDEKEKLERSCFSVW